MDMKGKGLNKLGDMPLFKKIASEVAPPLTAHKHKKLLDSVKEIRQEPDAGEAAFMARQLVQCTLPHANPGSVEAWQRRSGSMSLVIQPGWDAAANCSMGYPYGTIPRLLLFWVTTEAVRTKQRRLELGNSLAQFMRAVGLDPSHGGVRSDAVRLKDQMRRLFASRISFQQTATEADDTGMRWMNMDVAPKGELWWNPKRPDQSTLWQSWIELGEEFYNAITTAPVPFDTRALRALKRSPLALDLYAWVCYRVFSIVKKHLPRQFVPWTTLMRQLGTDYTDVKNFKKYAEAALRKVQVAYPGLVITKARGGFYLHATRLAIPERKT
jgi:hypothetical protein